MNFVRSTIWLKWHGPTDSTRAEVLRQKNTSHSRPLLSGHYLISATQRSLSHGSNTRKRGHQTLALPLLFTISNNLPLEMRKPQTTILLKASIIYFFYIIYLTYEWTYSVVLPVVPRICSRRVCTWGSWGGFGCRKRPPGTLPVAWSSPTPATHNI